MCGSRTLLTHLLALKNKPVHVSIVQAPLTRAVTAQLYASHVCSFHLCSEAATTFTFPLVFQWSFAFAFLSPLLFGLVSALAFAEPGGKRRLSESLCPLLFSAGYGSPAGRGCRSIPVWGTSLQLDKAPLLLCGIPSNMLDRDHGLLLRWLAQFTGKILALGMISARSVSTQQFPKPMKTLDVARLCVFISSNQQNCTMVTSEKQIIYWPNSLSAKAEDTFLAYNKVQKLPSAWFSDALFTVTMVVVNSSKSQLKSNLWA